MVETARKICKRLHAYVRMDRYAGKVHAVHDTSVSIDTPFGFVSILTNAHCLQPFSLVVNSTKQFPYFDIEEGQEVLIGDERIEIPACEFTVDLSQATDLDLSLETMQTVFLPVDLDIRMRHLLRTIETNAKADDLSPLVTDKKANEYTELIAPLLPKLNESFREQDTALCTEAASEIAGLGVGMIPSADRLLCGYMAGYAALSAALGRSFSRVLEMTRALASSAASHTTELSAAFLLQGGEGLVPEDLLLLLRNLLSDASYPTLVATANRIATLPLGGGADLLTGAYLSLSRLYTVNSIN